MKIAHFRKINLSILSLIFILLIFGTVTYAWISMSTINNIEGMSITATAGNELEISLDGENFANNLTIQELNDLFENIVLRDVTTTDGIDFTRGGLTLGGRATPNQHYLSFELWFRTTRTELNVYLINNVSHEMEYDSIKDGTYVVSRGITWMSSHDFQYGPEITDMIFRGETRQYFASEAIRIGSVELHDESNELDNRTDEQLKRFIFDPSENEGRGYGKPYGAYSFFKERTRVTLELPETLPNTSYRLSTLDPINPYQALDNESLIATLQETNQVDAQGRTIYQGKIRINVWIEGWDADAFDAIINDRIKIQLQFKIARRAINE
ncbi:hypothetical protein [Peloplasma aerotolerans]|uniref:Uncharacterized protein n=1 Tax=Peloplasma aerotolerans TaxID=3044389 RepID=A0AAW6U6B9_9MOLU|nr:hypothetical protein [Mariniplasma sp. M4Ah]MDI6452455.1 hypothetical protein [Mariniplasma sp. M4Ah]